MSEQRLISLHPKFAAFCDGVFSMLFLWLIGMTENIWFIAMWFVMRLLWWLILTSVVSYPPYLSRRHHLISLFLASVGTMPFLVFGDPSNLLPIRFIAVALTFISFWLIPSRSDSLSVMLKPHRRWSFFMSVFCVSGVWLSLEAAVVFQVLNGSQFIAVYGLAAFITSLISVWEWREYGVPMNKKVVQYVSILFLVLVELSSVLFLWPVGYFMSSFLITWMWYLVWLMFRFDLSGGIDWHKQRGFLVSNAVLVAAFLTFVVRWK